MDVSADQFRTYCEWYPCFYLHTLVQEIAKQNGLKITGSVTENKLYQSLVLCPFRGDMRRKDVKITTATGTEQTTTSTSSVLYTNFTEILDPEDLFASSTYTSNKSSKVYVTLTVTSINGVGADPVGTIIVVAGGVTIGTVTINISAGTGTGTYLFEGAVSTGETVTVRFSRAVALTTSISFAADIKIDVPTLITVGDFIRPDRFLPELSCLEIVKFVINYFGCSVYYDEYSKTITIDQIEGFKLEDAEDWSEYFQSKKTNYTIQGAANNYMRLADSDDTEIKAYNKQSVVKYGEGNITTGNTIKEQADILKMPFAATEFGLSKNGSWLSNIPLLSIVDEGTFYTYTAIGSEPPDAVYQYAGDIPLIQGQAFRIVDDIAGDIGIYIVSVSTTGGGIVSTRFYDIQFTVTGTGRLYPQRLNFNQIEPRLLVVKPETLLSDFSTVGSEYNLYDDSFALSAETTTCLGYFCKPTVGEPIDTMKANVAFDNPDIELYENPGVKTLYFNKISNMIGNPEFKVMMLLPEAAFQAFNFQSFIYLKTKDLTGYFWVESISNYRDSNTPVEVSLLML